MFRKIKALYDRLLALCLLLCWAVVAKSYVVTPLPNQSQLPVSNIHCIFQDSEGYMWYGTRGGGICRDNGYQIDQLGGDAINCITEDKQGRIWIGTKAGLFFLDKHDYLLKATPFKSETSALLCDSRGRLWASVGGSILCLNPNTRQVIIEDKRPKESAGTIYEDSQNKIWILFWGKIWRWTPKQKYPQLFIKTPHINASRILEDKHLHGYWIATWGQGIYFLDGQNYQLTPQPSTAIAPEQSLTLDIMVDSQRRLLYVSTLDNIYIYRINGKKLDAIDTSSFLSQEKKILDGLWLEKNGNLWVGGFIPTTFIISPNNWPIARYTIPQITQQTGYPLIADRCIKDNRYLWISQGRIGLVLYNQQTQKLSLANHLDINSRLIEKKHLLPGIWGAHDKTLLSLTADMQQQVAAQSICTFDSPITMIRDMGNHLLIGTHTGLYKLQYSQKNIQEISMHKLSTSTSTIKQAVEDVDGEIYYLTQGKELYHCAPNRKEKLLGNRSYQISCLDISPDGTLWMGTEDGKVYHKATNHPHFILHKELCNPAKNAIIDIQVDYLRHIWILSDQELKEMNPANGNMRQIHCQDANLQVANFYQLEQTGSQMVGVGAAGCYLEIAPSLALNEVTHQSHPIIASSYQIGDSTYIVNKGTEPIIIPADQSNITLHISTNQILDARNITFAYKLGDSNNWIVLSKGTNTVYLSNLPIGENTLQLKSTDEYGRWSDHITQISLYHTPHWWQTIWAKALFCLLGIGLLYILWVLNKRIHILSNLQKMRNRLSLNEIEIKNGHERQALEAEETLKAIIAHIETNISDSNYNVQRLSEDMCMSRTKLYRQIHNVSGLSVIEFIRDIRLKHAAQILKKHPDTTISIIHQTVGFTSNSYFTKCFKKKFGVTPSEYVKMQHTE